MKIDTLSEHEIQEVTSSEYSWGLPRDRAFFMSSLSLSMLLWLSMVGLQLNLFVFIAISHNLNVRKIFNNNRARVC